LKQRKKLGRLAKQKAFAATFGATFLPVAFAGRSVVVLSSDITIIAPPTRAARTVRRPSTKL